MQLVCPANIVSGSVPEFLSVNFADTLPPRIGMFPRFKGTAVSTAIFHLPSEVESESGPEENAAKATSPTSMTDRMIIPASNAYFFRNFFITSID